MSDKKEQVRGKGLFESNWHRTPNAMIDLVMGAHISPSAGWVVMTVIRYTEGMNGKKSAAIPTGTFKRVLGTKRDNTVYPYIDEAIDSGLIKVSRKKGCVSTYSINENCELWLKVEPLSESDTTIGKRLQPPTESDSSPLSESDTPPLSESATLIKIDINKDILKEQNEVNLFDDVYEDIKNHLKQGGIIPVGEPVIDDQLRPEVYKFSTWFNEKGLPEYQKPRQAVQWFQRIDIEERKRYYTPPFDHSRNYYNPDDYQKSIPVSAEAAAAIKAKYMGALGL